MKNSLSAHYAVFFVLLALFAYMVFSGFPDSSAPWFDEGINLGIAKTWAENGIFSLQTGPGEFVAEKPLLISTNYPLLAPVALSFKLFGVGLWQAKVVAYLFLAIFILLAYCLVKKHYGEKNALLSLALLITFLPLYGNGKSVLGEIPGLVYFFGGLLILSQNKNWPLFWAGILFGLAAATKSSYLLFVGALAAAEIYRAIKLGRLDYFRWLALGSGMIIPLLAWIYSLIPLSGFSLNSLNEMLKLYSNPYNADNTVLNNLKRFFTESTPAHYLLLLLAVVFAKVSQKLRYVFWAEAALLGFVGLNLIFYFRTVGWYRYFFPSHLALLILLPPALAYLFSRFPAGVGIKKYGATIIIMILAAVQLVVLLENRQESVYYNPIPRQFAGAVSEIAPQDKTILVVD